MDIEYLLVLQNARESLPDALETFFLWFSFVADGPALVALAMIVYWCVDKRTGLFTCGCFAAGNFVCQLAKNLICVYRPWIRSDAVVPTPDAIEGAGGYSFPSGHTTGAGTVFGSFAWQARKRYLWISILCVVAVLIIAFSRNYLGVHTPQDVLVGLFIAVVMVALTQLFFNWIDRYDALMPGHAKDAMVLVVVFGVCIASLIIVACKPYPLDYVDGQLLVDPESMQKGSFEAAGAFMGMALGWFLERRRVGFSTDGLSMGERAVRGIVGVAIVGATYVGCDVVLKAALPYLWAKFFEMFAVCVMALFVVPLLFGAIGRRFDKNEGQRPRVLANDCDQDPVSKRGASADIEDGKPWETTEDGPQRRGRHGRASHAKEMQ